jgi:hypothetical protein
MLKRILGKCDVRVWTVLKWIFSSEYSINRLYVSSSTFPYLILYLFKRTTLQTGRLRVRFPMVSLEFFSNIILPVALWPWSRLSLWQKWVPGVFSEGKGGRCLRLTTLPPSCAVVMKSGNFNFLEPSGPLQACNGTALSFFKFQVCWVCGL